MSQRCDICGKGPQVGCSVSHSKRRTKRRWLPNLRHIRILQGGRTVAANVCTDCISAGKVKRPA
jgi:large subunit ribosomal protein L28